jgi:hypothetical protein
LLGKVGGGFYGVEHDLGAVLCINDGAADRDQRSRLYGKLRVEHDAGHRAIGMWFVTICTFFFGSFELLRVQLRVPGTLTPALSRGSKTRRRERVGRRQQQKMMAPLGGNRATIIQLTLRWLRTLRAVLSPCDLQPQPSVGNLPPMDRRRIRAVRTARGR